MTKARRMLQPVSISRDQSFGFANAFADLHGLQQYSYSQMYFDKQQRRIAFRFGRERMYPGGFKLTKRPHEGVRVRAAGFFTEFGLDVERHAGRYAAERHPSRALGIDEDGDSFVIKLGRRRVVGE